MNILNLLIIVPLLTVGGILMTRDLRQSRLVAALGMGIQLILSFVLVYLYLTERAAGNTAQMLFMFDAVWFPTLNIHYAIGVDGISVAMIALTGIVVFTGIFASWEMESLPREFFISLIILATGVFGFFISIDLFTMFLFYELAVIPMYLLIGIWGSGPKEYSADGRLGNAARRVTWYLFLFCSRWKSFDFQYSGNIKNRHSNRNAALPVSVYIYRFRNTGCPFPLSYLVPGWSRFGPDSSIHASCRGFNEAWRLRGISGSHLPDA
jgi:NADH:ubiquinone oxidoreductase subunit 5 (subunit L)/multisubunit Na+/H+ antiporter MnhA subunit